jgi:hypothetical protein
MKKTSSIIHHPSSLKSFALAFRVAAVDTVVFRLASVLQVGRSTLLSLAVAGVLSIATIGGAVHAAPPTVLQPPNHAVWMLYTQWQESIYLVSSNLPYPAQFEPNNGSGTTTNIVIATNFIGTIQIGTNFYTRKDFADLAVIPKGNFQIWRDDIEANEKQKKFELDLAVAKGFITGWRNAVKQYHIGDTNTTWLGSVITGEALGGGKPRGLPDTKASDEQIGLRSDGFVVWRERP